jgi:hypothetical protein
MDLLAPGLIVALGKKAWSEVKKLQPAYARFWKVFERELKGLARDIPWDRLRGLRYDPEFVGLANGLIEGSHEKRKLFRRRIKALATPPQGSRYNKEEVIERVMAVADQAAAKAPLSDRDVTVSQGNQTRGLITEGQREVVDELKRMRGILDELVADNRMPPPAEPLAAPEPREPGEKAAQGTSVGESLAAIAFSNLLHADPDVEVTLEAPSIPWGEYTPYRPDFIVKDSSGVNWMVELSAHPNLPARAQEAVNGLEVLAQAASQELSSDWRVATVKSDALAEATSWSDLIGGPGPLT